MLSKEFITIPDIRIESQEIEPKVVNFELDTSVINYKLQNWDNIPVNFKPVNELIADHLYNLFENNYPSSYIYLDNEILLKSLIDQAVHRVMSYSSNVNEANQIIVYYASQIAIQIFEQIKIYLPFDSRSFLSSKTGYDKFIKFIPRDLAIKKSAKTKVFNYSYNSGHKGNFNDFNKCLNTLVKFSSECEFTLAQIIDKNNNSVLKWAWLGNENFIGSYSSSKYVKINFLIETDKSKYLVYCCNDMSKLSTTDKKIVHILKLWCKTANSIAEKLNEKEFFIINVDEKQIASHFSFEDLLKFQFIEFKIW